MGKLKSTISSVKRLWKGTFADFMKHYTYQIILGTHLESNDPLSFDKEIQEQLK